MLSYKMDFSFCACKPGFVKSSHIYNYYMMFAYALVHNSCNMRTRVLPDMYTLIPRALGVHIRQNTRPHTTIK